MLKKLLPLLAVLLLLCGISQAQYLMDMVDTSKDMGKGMLALVTHKPIKKGFL
jgi:hypothetical protein